jgi:hypothetical protein
MLNKLTPAQEALIPEYRDRFLQVGLSTAPADFGAAEAALRDAYSVAGLEPPKIFIRLRSPIEGAWAAALLSGSKFAPNVGDQVWDQVRAQVWDQVGDQVRAQVWDQVRDQVRDQVGAQVWDQVRGQVWDQVWDQVRDQVGAQVGAQVGGQVWDQVWDQVRDQVGAQVGDQVWDQVRDQVWDQVGDQVRAQVWDQVWDQVRAQVWDQVGAQVWAQVGDQVGAQVGKALYGQHDAGWLSFYSFFAGVGVPGSERMAPLSRLAEACGWCWAFSGAAIMTDRPSRLTRDGAFRLHGEDGPALEYRDGFSIYAWHGYRIPASHTWIIADKAKITPDAIDAEPNAELRRVMLEIMGFERYVEARGGKVVSEDTSHGRPRRLIEAEVGAETIRILDVQNGSLEDDGSRRRFHLGALRGAETPHQAVAMSYGRNPRTYGEAVRT